MLLSNNSSESLVVDLVIFQEAADKLDWMLSPIMQQLTCRTIGASSFTLVTQAQTSFNPETFYTFLIIIL